MNDRASGMASSASLKVRDPSSCAIYKRRARLKDSGRRASVDQPAEHDSVQCHIQREANPAAIGRTGEYLGMPVAFGNRRVTMGMGRTGTEFHRRPTERSTHRTIRQAVSSVRCRTYPRLPEMSGESSSSV